MVRKVKDTSFKDSVQVFLPALALTLAGFVLAYQFVDPAPPSRLVLAAGSTSGKSAAAPIPPRGPRTCLKCGGAGHDAEARYCKHCGMELPG